MINRIVIPQLFENMEEATIGAWLKREGDVIRRGDALCELITEKSTFELEAEADGILLQIAAGEKSVVPVHFIIGVIGEESDVLPDIEAENDALAQRLQTKDPAEKSAVQVPSVAASTLSAPKNSVAAASVSTASGGRVRATPAARRLAKELGVALEEVAQLHPGKVLSEEDVRSYAP